MCTANQLNRLKAHWESHSKEPLKVEDIGGTFYAFGSELACLRLAYKYRYGANEKIKAEYSSNLKSWYFSLMP